MSDDLKAMGTAAEDAEIEAWKQRLIDEKANITQLEAIANGEGGETNTDKRNAAMELAIGQYKLSLGRIADQWEDRLRQLSDDGKAGSLEARALKELIAAKANMPVEAMFADEVADVRDRLRATTTRTEWDHDWSEKLEGFKDGSPDAATKVLGQTK